MSSESSKIQCPPSVFLLSVVLEQSAFHATLISLKLIIRVYMLQRAGRLLHQSISFTIRWDIRDLLACVFCLMRTSSFALSKAMFSPYLKLDSGVGRKGAGNLFFRVERLSSPGSVAPVHGSDVDLEPRNSHFQSGVFKMILWKCEENISTVNYVDFLKNKSEVHLY